MNPSEGLNKNVVLEVLEKLQIRHIEKLTFALEPIEESVGFSKNLAVLKVSFNLSLDEKKMSFFVKLFPQTQVSINDFESQELQKEIFLYNLFDKIKMNARILNDCLPEIFLAEANKYLIMENLTEQYIRLNDHYLFSYSDLEVVLNSLAKFHASSLIYEEKHSCRIGDQYSKELEESCFDNSDNLPSKMALKAAFESINNCINILDFSKTLLSGKDFKTTLEKLHENIYDLVQPSKKFRNVICHGNLHITNILIKYEDKKPKTSKFVDFKNGRYTPPAQDVLSLIYLTTSRKFRSRFMYNLIGTYYTFLEKFITLAGYDLRTIISMEDFLNSCEEQKQLVLIQAVQAATCLPVLVSDDELIREYFGKDYEDYGNRFKNRSLRLLKHLSEDDSYKRRIRESLQDLKDYCDYL